MSYFLGIDIGSTAIKYAILNAQGELFATYKTASGGKMEPKITAGLTQLLVDTQIQRENIVASVATGYGRRLFPATRLISEITANALGAKRIQTPIGAVKSLLNIGGQDVKALTLDDNGICTNFAMNDKCAAGTGRFIEMALRILELEFDTIKNIDFSNVIPANINATCTVFAESEIVSHIAQDHEPTAIMAGVFASIAKRLGRLLRRIGLDDPVCIDGGPSLLLGMKDALETELMRPVYLGDHPQFTTAIGAAMLALKEA